MQLGNISSAGSINQALGLTPPDTSPGTSLNNVPSSGDDADRFDQLHGGIGGRFSKMPTWIQNLIYENNDVGFKPGVEDLTPGSLGAETQDEVFLNDFAGSSANSVGSSVLDDLSNSGSAVDKYLQLFEKTGETGFLEKYVDSLVNRENTSSARDYETGMSNTAFSRLIKDIESTGYNPWIALQGGNMASTPSVSAASGSMVDAMGLSNSKQNNIRSSMTSIIGALIAAFAMFAVFG